MNGTNEHDGNITSILNLLNNDDAFLREDENDDGEFYAQNRLVEHLDAIALYTVEQIIGQLITMEKPVILDLMAAWDSHLPSRLVPEKYQLIYNLNPMAGVIQGFRWSVFGGDPPDIYFYISMGVILVLFISSLFYFKKVENVMADIV